MPGISDISDLLQEIDARRVVREVRQQGVDVRLKKRLLIEWFDFREQVAGLGPEIRRFYGHASGDTSIAALFPGLTYGQVVSLFKHDVFDLSLGEALGRTLG